MGPHGKRFAPKKGTTIRKVLLMLLVRDCTTEYLQTKFSGLNPGPILSYAQDNYGYQIKTKKTENSTIRRGPKELHYRLVGRFYDKYNAMKMFKGTNIISDRVDLIVPIAITEHDKRRKNLLEKTGENIKEVSYERQKLKTD